MPTVIWTPHELSTVAPIALIHSTNRQRISTPSAPWRMGDTNSQGISPGSQVMEPSRSARHVAPLKVGAASCCPLVARRSSPDSRRGSRQQRGRRCAALWFQVQRRSGCSSLQRPRVFADYAECVAFAHGLGWWLQTCPCLVQPAREREAEVIAIFCTIFRSSLRLARKVSVVTSPTPPGTR